MNASQKNLKNDVHYEQQILDASSIGVLITRIGDGTILYANKAITSLLGIADSDSVIGKPVPNFYWDPEDRKALLIRFHAEGSITDNEMRARRTDGSMRWVSVSLQPFNFEGESVLLSEITDISARKQAEEALHASEEQFHSIYDNSTIGLYRTTPDGHILMINPTGLRLLGFDSFDEMSQRNLEESGFEQKDARKNFREKLEREGVIEQESEWTKKDGSTIYVREGAKLFRNEDGKVVYYDGSFEDITDRKKAEEALRASEQRYQTIFNSSPVMFWLKDANNNMIQINQAAAAFENVKPEELQGRSSYDVYPREQAEAFYQDDLVVIRSGKPKLGIVEKHTAPGTGKTTWVETGKVPILDDKGEVNGVLAFGVDITERQQAEETVRESKERFRRFTEATLEGLVFHEQGQIIDANPAGLTMFGLTNNAEFIGRNLLEFIAPESHQMVLQQMQSETVLPYEIQCIRNDGYTFPVETSTRTYKEGGRIIRASSIRDITERKQTEEAIRQSQTRFQTLVETLGEWVWEVDSKGTYTYISPNIKNLLGYEPEEVLGKTPFDLMPSEEAQRVAGIFVPLISNQQPLVGLENTNRRKDGSLIALETNGVPFFDANGQLLGYRGTDRDITERKQSEQALRENQQLLQLVMDNIPQSIFWKDKELTYLGVNQAFAEDTGFASPQEIVGRNDFNMPWKEQAELYRADDQQVLDRGETKLNYEEPQTNATGKVTWLRTSKIPMRDSNGQIFAVLGMYEDVTERKQAEEEMRRLQSAMEQTGDGIALADLSGNVLYANPAWAEMHGYVVEEILGKHLSIFHTPEQLEKEVAPFNEKAMATGGNSSEISHARKDGTTFPTLMTVAVQKNDKDEPVGLIGTIRDITERKQAEAELQQEKIFSDAVINGSAGTFFLFDIQGNMIRWNEEYEKVLGYTAEETRARNAVDPIADEDKENTAAAIGRGFTEGQTSVEANFVTKNGERIPYYFVARRFQIGNQMYLAGTGIDISERKQLEAEVQKAFERRGYQVQISTEISQEVAAAPELNELFGRVVTLTKERLGFYHTQLLRYDAAQDAVVLVNGYGEIGQKMLADGHQISLGSGLIGTAASSGETVLRPNLADDPDWQPNPLLPDTQGEIAVPIKLGDQILGVLDVQSNKAGALTEDDRLLLEGLCGQIAVAIEQTRLRQEMTERLEEVNRLYRSMSHEGWNTYRDTVNLPAGFMFDQTGTRQVDEESLTDEPYVNIPMTVLGGEVVGSLAVANDPRHPTSPEDQAFLRQVSDQIALALESARLSAQIQSALAQTEMLSEAGLRFARAADLQELTKIAVETLAIPKVNRAILETFNYDSANELDSIDIVANWWSGAGHEPTAIGTHYTAEILPIMQLFVTPVPLFVSDTFNDERIDNATHEIVKQLNIHALAILPLYLGTRQTGVLLLEADEVYNFKENETRLFSAMGPQIATVLENRRQYTRAQQQAERESTLNIINQKIQSATTVEAVLQIAARELGHALGAPMTIAQLSMKDKT